MWGAGYAIGGLLVILYTVLLIAPMERSHKKRKLALMRKQIRKREGYNLANTKCTYEHIDRDKALERYPIAGKVPGWYFRIRPLTANSHLAEGIDIYGRKIREKGKNPQHLLIELIARAKEVNRFTKPHNKSNQPGTSQSDAHV